MFKLTRRSHPLAFIACTLLVSAVLGYRGFADSPGEPTTRPSTEPSVTTGGDLITRLHRIASTQPMVLSTDDRSATRRFEFRVELVLPLKDGTNETADYLVARNGDDVAVLGQMKSGLPFCLMTNHLLVRCDPSNPGGFEEFDGGSPDVQLKADEKEKGATIEFSFRSDLNAPRLEFDAASLVRATLNRVADARWDNKTGTAFLRTEHSTVAVVLPPSTNPDFGIIQFAVFSNAKAIIAFSNIRLETREPSPILGITAEVIKAAGLKVHVFTASDRPQIGILAPADFGTNPKELEAAQTLRRIVEENGNATAVTHPIQSSVRASDAR